VRHSRELTVEFFASVVGLSTEGLNPRNIDPKFFSVKDCELVWGAECLDSHGFRYRKFCTDVDLIFRVEELWPKA
jgi:hypothetical protein